MAIDLVPVWPSSIFSCYMEVVIMTALRKHPGVVALREIVTVGLGGESTGEGRLYRVMEFMECDLHDVLRMNILEDIHKRYITFLLLRVIESLHAVGIIHRDLKPGYSLPHDFSVLNPSIPLVACRSADLTTICLR